ncbi:MAG: hypothetical protein Q9210_001066 [Variospora velana]
MPLGDPAPFQQIDDLPSLLRREGGIDARVCLGVEREDGARPPHEPVTKTLANEVLHLVPSPRKQRMYPPWPEPLTESEGELDVRYVTTSADVIDPWPVGDFQYRLLGRYIHQSGSLFFFFFSWTYSGGAWAGILDDFSIGIGGALLLIGMIAGFRIRAWAMVGLRCRHCRMIGSQYPSMSGGCR